LHDENWSKQETDRLFELCRRFDLRFVVIHDRWDDSQSKRSVEDLKERYYNICAILAKVLIHLIQRMLFVCTYAIFLTFYNTIQYIENLYSAAIQKCPGALTILKYIKTKVKSICDECTLEQKCLKPFLEYISVRAVLQVLR